ncbi:MAG: 3-oxoacyl-ACP reductase FabG [Gemmatimonadetes bacterium]|nr:3-oxoacyl-ACP reductase FabG [Gemmatimonadota bacterium]
MRAMRRTALVTGGGRGIGRAIVDALAEDAWVAAVDLGFPHGAGAAQRHAEVDVTDSAAVERAVSEVTRERGGLDWVVCAAGITRDHVSWKMPDADWQSVIDVNLTGVFNTARAVAPHLRKSTAGRLVFVGSINGLRGKFGQANYAAAKAGLVGLARTLALELARDGVTVNVVAPGFIDTPMTENLPEPLRAATVARTPLGRVGRPEEVAAAVRFLCSGESGFITGTVLPVDGGQLLDGVQA